MTTEYPRRWRALGALAVSLLAAGLDLTVFNVAVPTPAVDLGATTTQPRCSSSSRWRGWPRP